MLRLFVAFVRDDGGDDLVEYALLATVVGTAGAAVLQAFPVVMNAVYASWDAGAQALWEPADPSGP